MSPGRVRTQGLVFVVAVAAQAWTLGLPFQLDDYHLLDEPLRLFDLERAYAGEDVPPFMLRWPLWGLWALLARLGGTPLSPALFHACGLLLHGTCAALLAGCVDRLLERRPEARHAGLLAGLGFGAATGHVQAVSWTAAWSDLLTTLFGLLALAVFLRARKKKESGGSSTLALRTLGALALFLTLVSKTQGVVVVAAVAWILLAAAAFELRARAAELRREAAAFALALAAGFAGRWLFLGTVSLRYYERGAASPLETLARLPAGFAALGQALFPWNADPLFAGDEPLLASLLGKGLGWSAPLVAAVFALPILATAFLRAPRVRGPLGALAVAALACVVPAAVLYEGRADNVVSRVTYLPMAVLMAALGVACAALWNASRSRALCAAPLLALGLLLADGGIHLVRTELLAAREQVRTRALVAAVRAEHAAAQNPRELAILVLRADGGFAGIPALGPNLTRAFRPPFVEEPLDVRVYPDGRALLARYASSDLAQRDVIVLAPAVDASWTPLPPDPQAPGVANRERRAMRRLTGLRMGIAASQAERALALTRDPAAARWAPAAPISAHAVRALRIESAALTGGELFARTAGGRCSLARLAPATGLRIVEPEPSVELVFGPAIEAFEWEGTGDVPSLALATRLPEVEVTSPREVFPWKPGSVPAPTWTCRLPAALRGAAPPRAARLELVFRDHGGGLIPLYADVELPADAESFELRPSTVHFAPDEPPPLPPLPAIPWEELARERILPELEGGRLRRLSFTWRVTLYLADGNVTARSAYRTARFERAPRAAEEP